MKPTEQKKPLRTSERWNAIYNKEYKNYIQILKHEAPSVNIEHWDDPGDYPSGAGGGPLSSYQYIDSIDGGTINVKLLPAIIPDLSEPSEPKATEEFLSEFADDFAKNEWGVDYISSWDIKITGDTAEIEINDFDSDVAGAGPEEPDDDYSWDSKLYRESSKRKIHLLILKEYIRMSIKSRKNNRKSELDKFRKLIKEELEKIYKTKVTKESPKSEIQRKENADDKVKLNMQADAQMKRDGSSKPSDKDWKESRLAKEPDLVPTFEQYNEYITELWNTLEKDLPKLQEVCKKFGDKELDSLVGRAMDLYTERSTRFVNEKKHITYTEMKNSLAAIGHRIISLEMFLKEKAEKSDVDKAKKIILDYLKKQDAPKPKKAEK